MVPFERVLAQTEKVAVCVSRLAAYRAGFEFDVVTMSRDRDGELDPLMFHAHRFQGGATAGGIPPGMLRIGVRFADGSKATNTGLRPTLGRITWSRVPDHCTAAQSGVARDSQDAASTRPAARPAVSAAPRAPM